MLPLNTVRPTRSPFKTFSQSFFVNYFKQWNKQLIYPPQPTEITTKNRLFPNYIENTGELHNILLFKEPLLLHFTYPGDSKANKLTSSLFNVLSDKALYPLDSNKYPVNLVNIACDSAGGRDILMTYGIGTVPSILLLKKQTPVDKYEPKSLEKYSESDLIEWLKLSIEWAMKYGWQTTRNESKKLTYFTLNSTCTDFNSVLCV